MQLTQVYFSRMKKFFEKIKKDYKFKKAGTGRRLDEERQVTPKASSTVYLRVMY